MATCSNSSSEKCIPDYTEDKYKGVCKIKEEFIVDDHVRILSKDCLTKEDKEKINQLSSNADETTDEPAKKRAKLESENDPKIETGNNNDDEGAIEEEPVVKKIKLDERRDKLKGQNKSRPPPFKTSKERNLCPWIVDQAEDEPEKKCPSPKCTFMHDRAAYLKIKEPDIDSLCYLFNMMGRCPRGAACRYASKHLSSDGLNIVDKEKFEAFSKKNPATKNKMSPGLQEKLRKRKYNFNAAEKIVKTNDGSGPKKHCNGLTRPSNNDEAKGEKVEEKRLGAVPDHDLIKLRPEEKKKIEWRDKILLSPLTTVGNLPFRRICKEYGADITCGEMALAPKILKGVHEEWALVKRHESEDIFGVQICGNNPGVLTRCAQLLSEQTEIDYIDLNLGCPIDLIYKHGGGSGMLNRTNVLQNVVKSVSQVLDIPLTIKTRMGVYMDKPIAHNLMPKFREWGASMITVHGRSREQRYTKMADWEYIETCAKNADPIPVFGNGDILSFDDYQRVRASYPTVQGITIGRGALIKPWIFSEIKEQKLYDISSSERLDMLKKYANYGMEHWGSDTRGVETTRRFMLEWISFLHRYIPVGILEQPPQRINERPPYYKGRDELETLMASSNCADWIKLSEMFLGKTPDGFHFLPKHKANSWK
ncbi:Similar to DUS3L: tRNA-dihydrouridine(47) synthase [NAD(P)()]-like (Homo sapiens) [Cotesia congregata]|uniref:tRNA-dihydrouridine(47) synthase [NAD(P)(+)] n=1 Tax=Cotesia congregata TaxID=51543 RepID=A0A8J2MYP7_COTCN|nr:Similar to DUS3L: tRNA-dihydrouridine(47) synthase [NAD(P)()]-like (Homo sapiens) [Cotesia congregata]